MFLNMFSVSVSNPDAYGSHSSIFLFSQGDLHVYVHGFGWLGKDTHDPVDVLLLLLWFLFAGCWLLLVVCCCLERPKFFSFLLQFRVANQVGHGSNLWDPPPKQKKLPSSNHGHTIVVVPFPFE